MMMATYTSMLGHGLGMIEETRALLDLWQEGISTQALTQAALRSGRFRQMSARRLRNFVESCFVPRYLRDQERPAKVLKSFEEVLSGRELAQMMFIYTCRANPILADFVRDVYWNAYVSGRMTISNDEARAFVTRANQDGKTTTPWTESMIVRVARYLTGCCADFGLLSGGKQSVRDILPFRIEQRVAAILAYELHFAGLGDNRLVDDPQWALFGLDATDVLDELKRLSLKGIVIVQQAGNAARIGWPCKTMEELCHAIAER
jgi:hypothetical protein